MSTPSLTKQAVGASRRGTRIRKRQRGTDGNDRQTKG